MTERIVSIGQGIHVRDESTRPKCARCGGGLGLGRQQFLGTSDGLLFHDACLPLHYGPLQVGEVFQPVRLADVRMETNVFLDNRLEDGTPFGPQSSD